MNDYTTNLFLIITCLLLTLSGYGQTKAKCGYNHYMQTLDKKHPGLSAKINEAYSQSIADKENHISPRSTAIVNVVFHIINSAVYNIPDDVIMNQLDQLNKDFNRQNDNANETRDIFTPVAGSMNIQFQLATTDPLGNLTSGINRYFNDLEVIPEITFLDIQTALDDCGIDITEFDPFDPDPCFAEALYGDLDLDKIKRSAEGGVDPWDVDRYINIWVGNLNLTIAGFESPFILGFAYPPYGVFEELDTLYTESEIKEVDGIVLHYQAVGPGNPFNADFQLGLNDMGRTLTHEMGHYLGLRHAWGDGDCTMDDQIDDTPPMAGPANATLIDSVGLCGILKELDTCPDDSYPDMYENYMNYSTDKCQNMFTQEQVELMDFMLNNRRQTLLDVTSINEISNLNSLSIYPNPVTDEVQLDLPTGSEIDIQIFNSDGQKVITAFSSKISLGHLTSGVYIIQSTLKGKVSLGKIVKL